MAGRRHTELRNSDASVPHGVVVPPTSRSGSQEDVMAKPIPEGLHSITPNLVVDGAAEAIEFYKRAFGAEELMRAPDPTGEKVWDANLRIGDSCFFVNDTAPEMGATATPSSLWIYAPD